MSNQTLPSSPNADSPATNEILSDQSTESMVRFFKLASDGTRLRIMFLLMQEHEINVRTLCGLLQQSQPAVSHHLGLLRVAGVIACRRDGKHNYYHLVREKLEDLVELLFTESASDTGVLNLPNCRVSCHRD